MEKVLGILGLNMKILYGIASAEGLAEAMQGASNIGIPTCIVADEFRSLVTKGQQKAVGNLIPKLTELYDSPDKIDVPTRTNPLCVEKPLAALISATTPTWLTSSVSDEDASSGFLNRFMTIHGESTNLIAIPVPLPDKELDQLAFQIAGRIKEADGPFELSTTAKVVYENFYREFRGRRLSETAMDLTERGHLHVMKVSLIFAVLNGHKQIEVEDVNRGILVVKSCMRVAIALAPDLGVGRGGKLESRVLSFVSKNGPSSAREIYRGLNSTADEVNRALAALLKINMLTVEERGGGSPLYHPTN